MLITRTFRRASIARGAVDGLIAAAVLYGLLAGMRHVMHGFRGSGVETAVSLLALVCYLLAGYRAVDDRHERAAIAGAVAGALVPLVVFVASYVIWFVTHRHGAHYLRGPGDEHANIALLGPLVFGAVFGALGGWWARRRHPRGV